MIDAWDINNHFRRKFYYNSFWIYAYLNGQSAGLNRSEEKLEPTIYIFSFIYRPPTTNWLLCYTCRFFLFYHINLAITLTTWTLAIATGVGLPWVEVVWRLLSFTWFAVRTEARKEHSWSLMAVHNYFFPNSTTAIWSSLLFGLSVWSLHFSQMPARGAYSIQQPWKLVDDEIRQSNSQHGPTLGTKP